MDFGILAAKPEGLDDDDWVAAVDAVRAYCGWHIAPPITETITLDGSGGHLLTLPSLRVVEIEKIVNDGREVTDPEWSADGMVRGAWSRRFRGVEVTMRHGFEDLPPVVIAVATSVALTELTPGGVSSDLTGPFQVSYDRHSGASETGMSQHQRAALEPYRLKARP